MMRAPKILAVSRPSISSKIKYSRSVYSRLLEPVAALNFEHHIPFQVVSEAAPLHELLATESSLAVFSKSKSIESLKAALELKRTGCKIVYDLDEFIFGYPSYSSIFISSPELEIIKNFLQIADEVTVSTHRLATALAAVINRKYRIIKTGFSSDWSKPLSSFTQMPLKIIFVNGDTLKLGPASKGFLNAMQAFLSAHLDDVRMTIVSDQKIDLVFPNVSYQGSLDWLEYRKFMGTHHFDLAIVPLGGNEEPETLLYNSCKTPIKFIEYGGYGIPALFSETPLYSDLIVDGKEGFLVKNTETEWLEKLNSIFQDRSSLGKIAIAAQSKVLSQFSLTSVANEWLLMLRDLGLV